VCTRVCVRVCVCVHVCVCVLQREVGGDVACGRDGPLLILLYWVCVGVFAV